MKIVKTVASLMFAIASFWMVSVIAAPMEQEPWNKGVATADMTSGWTLTH